MSPKTTITPLPPRHPPSYTTPPSHHITNYANIPTSFINPWPSYRHTSPTQALQKRWFSTSRNFVPVPKDPSHLVPVQTPSFPNPSSPSAPANELRATWIGHASFLLQFRSFNILLDPVFSQRVGPYNLLGPTRFTALPCTVDDLPDIDAVLISHDHYDHLDAPTLQKLEARKPGTIRYLCGLGLGKVLLGLGAGIREGQVREMDWWDGVRRVEGGIEFICTPAQHRSGRVPWAFESTLWCSWIVSAPTPPSSSISATTPASQTKRLFFAGDTGYCAVSSDSQLGHQDAPHPPCPAFKEIGELYGPFDLALLPIGCFKPRAFMAGVHSSPDDSITIHKDIKSKKSIGMHYGTFRGNISAQYEPVTEPPERWEKVAQAEGLEWGKEVGLCDIGQTVVV
ncbi:Metallo-hydrolase/oxidoreductase [Lophiostoma macrostomum CBS 122681]|uniref:Metallo-hydrolase/oxidoreductase n=1 Tax=Lophiostoma macrostomum CBS 122681 TaxID=1314788 RepID=A0A6A6TRS7_9PLEO|nr:Metallo-hydrolase/oxidoreductase [Lophiostoma macrostomum CBS 122681]